MFAVTESLDGQMKRIQSLRGTEEGQERCKQMFKLGEQLVECAHRGQLSRFQRLAVTAEAGDILLFHVIKMLHGALKFGHLLLAGYIIDNGFPINKNMGSVPNCLHESLRSVDDERACAIVEFLVDKKMDINVQEPQNWDTALHIAIRKNLFGCCIALINAGADVNAVAKSDIMPLQLAEASLSDNEEGRSALISLLLERGARRTWRRQTPDKTPAAPARVSPWGERFQTTMVRANAQQPASPAPAPASAPAPDPAADSLGGLTSVLSGVNIKISGNSTSISGSADENGWCFRTHTTPPAAPTRPQEAANAPAPAPAAAAAAPLKKVSFSGGFGNNSVRESVSLPPPSHLVSTAAPAPARSVPPTAPGAAQTPAARSNAFSAATTTTINRAYVGTGTSLSSFIHAEAAGAPDTDDLAAPEVADGKGSYYKGVPPDVDIELPLPTVLAAAGGKETGSESVAGAAEGACAGVSFQPSARKNTPTAAGEAQIFSTGSGQIFSTEQ
jgi:hypothetical protein